MWFSHEGYGVPTLTVGFLTKYTVPALTGYWTLIITTVSAPLYPGIFLELASCLCLASGYSEVILAGRKWPCSKWTIGQFKIGKKAFPAIDNLETKVHALRLHCFSCIAAQQGIIQPLVGQFCRSHGMEECSEQFYKHMLGCRMFQSICL